MDFPKYAEVLTWGEGGIQIRFKYSVLVPPRDKNRSCDVITKKYIFWSISKERVIRCKFPKFLEQNCQFQL